MGTNLHSRAVGSLALGSVISPCSVDREYSSLFLSPSLADGKAFRRQNNSFKCLVLHCSDPVGRGKAAVHGIKHSCTHGRVCQAFKAFPSPRGREFGI